MLLKNIFLVASILIILTVFLTPLSVATTLDVNIVGFAFDPEILTIQVGDTVRWTNNDIAFHTSTSDTLVWDSGLLSNGEQFEFKFLKPGTYTYHCAQHPLTMKDAQIIVEGTFGTDKDSILENSGGTVNFFLEAGSTHQNRMYLVLSSVSGTSPGTSLPGGMATLPLNWDFFTQIVLSLLNSAVFMDFFGTLDGSGNAIAQLNAPPVPGFSGITMHYAYVLNNPFNFASNPVAIDIVP